MNTLCDCPFTHRPQPQSLCACHSSRGVPLLCASLFPPLTCPRFSSYTTPLALAPFLARAHIPPSVAHPVPCGRSEMTASRGMKRDGLGH